MRLAGRHWARVTSHAAAFVIPGISELCSSLRSMNALGFLVLSHALEDINITQCQKIGWDRQT